MLVCVRLLCVAYVCVRVHVVLNYVNPGGPRQCVYKQTFVYFMLFCSVHCLL